MRLRIVCHNIQRGIHRRELVAGFLADVRVRTADLIAIQEAGITAGYPNVLEEITPLVGPAHRWLYAPVMTYPGKEYGNGFIHGPELEPAGAHILALPRVSSLGAIERAKTEGGQPDTKSAFLQRFRFGGGSLRVANVHMDFAGGATHRARQLRAVLADLDACAELQPGRGEPVIDVICGDFNSSGLRPAWWSRAQVRQLIDEAEREGFTDCTAHVRWTSDMLASIDPADPAGRPMRLARALGLRYRQKHDHILARGAMRVVASGTLAPGPRAHPPGSDHLALFADLDVVPFDRIPGGVR